MQKPLYSDIDAIFFDFDGVLTDNSVYLNEKGEETVRCSRADGLGFNVLRKLKINCFIVSTEKNKVVYERAKKIGIQAHFGINNKLEEIKTIAKKNKYRLPNCIFVGNDLNDLDAMEICGYGICPADSHKKVINNSRYVLKTKGGFGVVRELIEDFLECDTYNILYKNN